MEKVKSETTWLEQLPSNIVDIFKMEEDNIYLKKEKSINIFREAKSAMNSEEVKDSFLEEHHFVEKSILESFVISSQVKIDCFKHISKFARLLVSNDAEKLLDNYKIRKTKENVLDYLYESDLNFDLNNLSYRTLMNIAAGRFTSEFFSNTLLEIEDVAQVHQD